MSWGLVWSPLLSLLLAGGFPTFWGESGLEFGSLLVSIPPTLFDVTSLLRLTETVLPVFGLFSVLVAHCRCY